VEKDMSKKVSKEQRAADRRKGDRRGKVAKVSGADRRKADRREAADRRRA
jgi:hypothetical protein